MGKIITKLSFILLLSVILLLGAGYSNFEANGEELSGAKTIGFWKNNIRKAMEDRTKGVQINKDTLESHLSDIEGFYLNDPFGNLSLSQAHAILSSTGQDPVGQLKKQLLAAELNYFNGANIVVSVLEDAEDMVNDPGSYTREQILDMAADLDDFNNGVW